MRPLVSPIFECRLMGRMQLAGGCVLAAVALGVDGVVAAAVSVLFGAGFFGAFMYVLVYRRFVRRAFADPAPAPTDRREPLAATRRRVVLMTVALFVAFAVIAAVTVPSAVAGVCLGNGAACVGVSRLCRQWEDEHGCSLLREPRWRFSRAGPRGWGRGRGTLDPQDFYWAGRPAPGPEL